MSEVRKGPQSRDIDDAAEKKYDAIDMKRYKRSLAWSERVFEAVQLWHGPTDRRYTVSRGVATRD